MILNRSNCRVDPKSGGIIFNGSPELQEILNLQADIRNLHAKLDKLMELIKREDGIEACTNQAKTKQ